MVYFLLKGIVKAVTYYNSTVDRVYGDNILINKMFKAQYKKNFLTF